MVTLRPMTPIEYQEYRTGQLEGYAQTRARNFGTPIEEERQNAERQIQELLPIGVATPNHALWTVVDDDGMTVGHLWVYLDGQHRRAFIYDIEIVEARRGKGFGKQTLDA